MAAATMLRTAQAGAATKQSEGLSGASTSAAAGIQSFYLSKIQGYELLINERTQNLRRLEAQRNALNARVRLLREELQLLQEPGSYVGEVVKVMGKKKVLVKVQPEGKYGGCGGCFAMGSAADIQLSQSWTLHQISIWRH